MLLIRKSRGPYTGRYDLPGGSPEDGELLVETLRREVQEETGCTVRSSDQLGAFDVLFPYDDPELGASQLRHIGVVYVAEIEGEPRRDSDGHDSDGCEWVETAEVLAEPDRFTPFVHRAMQAMGQR